ncbi:MAG: WecB/TagA/CpsF family glycosyltransferase [Leptolyngbyaceae bacterium]|nr:WecB/TagA/CpsF family glycosyltransferase [Leptolyngbyaceae bacterium]
MNISIDNLSTKELLNQLHSGVVFTPNVDHLVKLQADREFFQIYQSADYRVCDSKILLYAARFLGMRLKEKVSGSDLFPAFYQFHRNNTAIKIFLLGSQHTIAQEARKKINAKVQRNMVVAAHSPSWGFEKNESECLAIVEMINRSGATVLAVGVGAPKQEKWIAKYRDQLPNIKVFLAIGATIDFEAGRLSRAPKWMSEVGLEWFYRLISEPRRLWKRYLVEGAHFFWLVLKQKLNLYRGSL